MDPLTLVYDALWVSVSAHPKVAEMVKLPNRVNFNTADVSLAKPRRTVQGADLPELILTYEGFSGPLRSSSSSSSFDVRWAWVLTTGDMRLNKILLPLSWAITEAMVAAHRTLLSIQWEESQIVKSISLTDVRAGESDVLRASNIRGWSTVHSLTTHLILPTAAMVAAATPSE